MIVNGGFSIDTRVDTIRLRRIVSLLATAAIIALPAAASAQDTSTIPADATSASDASAPHVEEIVVTARRTEENLQSVPVAVTAVTAATIATRNLRDISGLAGSTPSLTLQPVGRGGAAGQPALFLRGIGQADSAFTTDPAVGMYVDGVYLARNIGNVLYLGDIQRVEVLRGPQGTLFGKNTIGGAINITTIQPSDHFEIKAEATVGDYNRRAGRLIVNTALTDNLFLRVAGFVDLQDGYIKLNNYPGKALGDNNVYGGQIKLRWQPSSNLKFDFGFDYTMINNTGSPLVLTAVYPQALTTLFYNQFYSGSASCLTAAGQATNSACFGPVQIPKNIYRSNEIDYKVDGTVTDPYSDNRQIGLNLSTEWKLDFATLTSITSYRTLLAHSVNNLGFFGPIFFNGIRDPDKNRQFSEEIRLNGTAFDDKLSWVAGAYYFKEHFFSRNPALSVLARLNPGNTYPLFVTAAFKGNTENISAFTQLTYKLLDNVRLTGGARYTHERKEVQANIVPGAITNFAASQSVNRIDPMASISVDLATNVIAYGSYSQGFRSGGFPTRVPSGLTVLPTFGPEKARAFEVGLKNEFFDRRLRANFAVFRTIYSDIQTTGTSFVYTPPQPTIINAGRARIQGVEAELTGVLNRYLTLDGSASYLDPKFTEVNPTARDGAFPITTASRLTYTPKWKLHGGATLTLPLADGELVFRGDIDYSTRIYFNLANTIFQDSVTIVNASVAYRFGDHRTEIVLGSKNLTNRTYYTSGQEDRLSNGLTYLSLAQPRTVFVTLRWKM